MDILELNEQEINQLSQGMDSLIKLIQGNAGGLIRDDLLIGLIQKTFTVPYFPLVTKTPLEPIYRLTNNTEIFGYNKRIDDICYLKAPPTNVVVKFGRCNLKNQSIFYGTFNHLTMISEKRPQIGNLVTVSTWIPKKDATLVICPIFKNQPLRGNINHGTFSINKDYEKYLAQYPIPQRQFMDKLYQFYTNEFSKRIVSNDREYVFSAYYSDIVLNVVENGAIEAIRYPSVGMQLSFDNIAIKASAFDSKYTLDEVYDGVIRNDVWIDVSNRSKDFSFDTGKINWSH